MFHPSAFDVLTLTATAREIAAIETRRVIPQTSTLRYESAPYRLDIANAAPLQRQYRLHYIECIKSIRTPASRRGPRQARDRSPHNLISCKSRISCVRTPLVESMSRPVSPAAGPPNVSRHKLHDGKRIVDVFFRCEFFARRASHLEAPFIISRLTKGRRGSRLNPRHSDHSVHCYRERGQAEKWSHNLGGSKTGTDSRL